MGKKPFFPFFTGDWVQDTRILSLQAKGAWIDLLTAMWHNHERGRLTLTWVGLSRLLGASVDSTKAALANSLKIVSATFSLPQGEGVLKGLEKVL